MNNIPDIGIQIPQILLPKSNIDLKKWSVIACDQYTSQPEYWDEVSRQVGDSPSTYHMILPEVYLNTPVEAARSNLAWEKMKEYQQQGIFQQCDGMIYVERTCGGKTRRGIMLALDLECYDFTKGSQSLIRATEGTILDRLPPRMRIREGASLELPHILVLIDDPEDRVFADVQKARDKLPVLYDFDLMQNSGHLIGRIIDDLQLERKIIQGLQSLARPEVFYPKYNVSHDYGVLLFAMGDGNHSLATAKMIWEKLKPSVGLDHPASYALVEIENIHDKGLDFEPIHRVVFGVNQPVLETLQSYFEGRLSFQKVVSAEKMKEVVDKQSGPDHLFGLVTVEGFQVGKVASPSANLPVGSLEPVLVKWKNDGKINQLDYVHGFDTVCTLGSEAGNVGFYLPAMQKDELFRTVILDGALPRKTFSMGEAHEKRFYMEARRIQI